MSGLLLVLGDGDGPRRDQLDFHFSSCECIARKARCTATGNVNPHIGVATMAMAVCVATPLGHVQNVLMHTKQAVMQTIRLGGTPSAGPMSETGPCAIPPASMQNPRHRDANLRAAIPMSLLKVLKRQKR
eukprot:CAMPEP_0182889428 /NCGR_PEP_ID=MMETSP0034_2-20130328/22033_1 /TAXON_ID=156128 /ORGANISM="Nephroselmis pyriformis, Strain CCMP717" /LENGTH=129 /DNA_ID=CAMNT_0025022919 /DNA_START=300 /DNA_END=686 /DNA_ORIENTATION=-